MKTIDHTAYPKSLKNKTLDQLIWTRDDAHQAERAMPDGENAGYYLDEVNYISMELNSRQRGMKTVLTTQAKTEGLDIKDFTGLKNHEDFNVLEFLNLVPVTTWQEWINVSDGNAHAMLNEFLVYLGTTDGCDRIEEYRAN